MSGSFEAKGLSGLSRCFRTAVEATKKGGAILFVGSPFTCLPFAEFLCYAIKDLALKPYFMPSTELGKIREIVKIEGYGCQLGDFSKDSLYQIVVLLGGIGMPKYGLPPEAVKGALSRLSDLQSTIAVCFQGSLKKPEWMEAFNFGSIIHTDLTVKME